MVTDNINTDVKIYVIGDSTNNENSHNEHITGLQDKLQNELIARFSDPNEETNINNPFEFDCDLSMPYRTIK